MPELRRLSAVLLESSRLPWNHALYLPSDEEWSLFSRCAVLDEDESDGEDETRKFASQHGLAYALGVQQIQDIMTNARAQRPNASAEELFEAFLYYYDHDAYISFRVRTEDG